MNFRKNPIALATLTLCGALPLSALAAPTVSFKAPADNAIISGAMHNSSACEAVGTDIIRVDFYLGSTHVSRDNHDPWQCKIDTREFADGDHALRAVAFDRRGRVATAEIDVRIQNDGGSTPSDPTPTDPGNSAPTVSFKAPTNGETLSAPIEEAACEAIATDADGVTQVQFFVDDKLIRSEGAAPWNCAVNPNELPDGTHTLKAVATDSKGATGSAQIAFNVGEGGSTPSDPDPDPVPTNPAPTVSFKAPTNGQTITTAIEEAACEAIVVDDKEVKQVEFFLDDKLIRSEGVAPWNCAVNPNELSDGTHMLKAVATDAEGGTGSAQVALSIDHDGSSTPTDPDPSDPTDPTTPPGTPPSGDAKAIATFESLGLYWKPPSNPGAAGCTVRYRKAGTSTWKEGLAMWYDSRNSECRGSLVQLSPGTSYEVQLGMPGKTPEVQLTAKTWSENFPIAKTVQVTNSSQTLNITEGGTRDGYVLYTGPATLDVANGKDFNVTISAPYVILRGLTLKGARIHGINILPGAHDVVIEDSDISEWGRYSGNTSSDGWKIGVNTDSAIHAFCRSPDVERIIIQRNKIHHPRYGSNSWSDGHPSGANGVLFSNCGGNHVFRYNEFYSEWGRYFMDPIGGQDNFSALGMPNADTDIYGNIISHSWDDAIEAEGANRNVRIWGNYMDLTSTGVATTATHVGPVYIFRNVYNRSRFLSMKSLDDDQRNAFGKSGSNSSFGGGRRYVLHNTLLQAAPPSGSSLTLGAGHGLKGNSNQPMTNTVSRNNVFHIWKSHWPAIYPSDGAKNNDLDYDLYNGNITAYAGAEAHGIVGTPIYQSGHGWQSGANGLYQLAPNSPGYDKGARLPNFNDGYSGAGPDMGAHEAGKPAMKFGVN